jgi:hypothetical protein
MFLVPYSDTRVLIKRVDVSYHPIRGNTIIEIMNNIFPGMEAPKSEQLVHCGKGDHQYYFLYVTEDTLDLLYQASANTRHHLVYSDMSQLKSLPGLVKYILKMPCLPFGQGSYIDPAVVQQKVSNLRIALDLDAFFPDVDDDLLTMTVTPAYSSSPPDVLERLHHKYNVVPAFANYEALEFYGDRILNTLIVNFAYINLGLNKPVGPLNDFCSALASNKNLTWVSQRLGACERVFGIKETQNLTGHNICADNIEAVIGALYVQYGLAGIDRMSNWLSTLEPFITGVNDHVNQLS